MSKENKRIELRRKAINAMVILGAMAFALLLIVSVVSDGEKEEFKQGDKAEGTVRDYSEKFDGEDGTVQWEDEKKDLKETKVMAEQFIRAYLSYDSKKPDQKLKEMNRYLSHQMKESLEEPDIPDGVEKGEVIAVEFLPESTQKGSRFFWAVKTQVETKFSDDRTEKAWTLHGVIVEKEEDRWVIVEVGPIGDAGAEPLELGEIKE